VGIWSEETESFYDDEAVFVKMLNREKTYQVEYYCDLIHAEKAEPLAVYDSDFYKGRPALTVNEYGNGKAYYIAFRNDGDFLADFYNEITTNLRKSIDAALPYGVTAQTRGDFIFLMNFTGCEQIMTIHPHFDMLEERKISGDIKLDAYGIKVLKRI